MRLALALCCVFACGCGYVGDPLPPALNIPQPVSGLSVEQRGDRLHIVFAMPSLTTEGLPLKTYEAPVIEINGERVEAASVSRERAVADVPVDRWAGQTVTVRVRAAAGGKTSDWVEAPPLAVVQPLAAPANLQAESDPRGVRITWGGELRSGVTYTVSRQGAADDTPVPAGTTAEQSFVDGAVEYGKTYSYTVRASLGSAQSEPAGPVKITPADTFAPAVPTSLAAVAGVGSIELAWERNTESDLAGYRVYRAAAGAEPQLLADAVDAPAYSDRQVESGKQYAYTVTSIDARGNESRHSQPVEIAAP